MPLSVGARLGHYEVLSLLGKGGMGEVYRANDTTLGRQVALKVLPAVFLRDPDRLARFQREAQVLASLDHPNIGPIFGIVESEDSRALVLALVEGPTLADRIDAGPVPPEEALYVAKQMVDALEYAHDRGVVHRDLKPANVKITPDGVVKVLDFGLAKVLEDDVAPASAGALTNSPTLTLGHTRAGMILGTAAYMSPEQAVGRPADRRSDIFSFGAVLYEMLAGKRAFAGKATPDVLEAVVKNDPDWSALPVGTPAYLRRLMERTLAKDRKQRLQAIGEARIVLEKGGVSDVDVGATHNAGATHNVGATAGTGSSGLQAGGWLWPSAAAVLATVAAVALWAPWRAEKTADRPLMRLDVDLGADVSMPPPVAGGSSIAISPDGSRLAYLSGNPAKLFTRRLDQPKANELPGTSGAIGPFFSPDGQWIGFAASGKLDKISVEGGAVVPLTDVPNFAGASWGQDGKIVVSNALSGGLLRIPAEGGTPETLAELGKGELAFGRPQVLPGGKAVLFTTLTAVNADTGIIEVMTVADRRRRIMSRAGTHARYLPTSNAATDRVGHLIYFNKGTLFAIPFDVDKLETRGTAVPVLEDVAYETNSRTMQMDFSAAPPGHGNFIYRRGGVSSSLLLSPQWVDPAGKREPLRARPGIYANPSVSLDGRRVALTLITEGGSRDVWVYDQQRDAMTRLTFGGQLYASPIWSPDGQYVVFGSFNSGLYWTRADGASQPQVLTQSRTTPNVTPSSLTPDGRRVAFYEGLTKRQVWTVAVENQGGQWKAGKPEQFLNDGFNDLNPVFSPDGRWLAYQSTESGTNEVYVRGFPPPASGQGGKWQISNNGGVTPHWSRSGHDLLYQSGDQIMAASYSVKGDSFVPEKPRVWIAKLGGTEWDLAPDGKRALVLSPEETAEAHKQDHEIVFLENFFDELRRRVPAAK